MAKLKGLILSGGRGTRLRPLTHTGPKQLIPLANKPVILYALEDLKNAGITDIGVVLGHNMPERVEELLGNGANYGVNITYIYQSKPLGIAHAVACAQKFVGEDDLTVYLGDNILKSGISEFVNEFRDSDYEAGILLSHIRDPGRFGVAEIKNGKVVRLVEKPKKPISDLALVGVYLFSSSIFEVIKTLKPSWRNELEITEAIDKLVQSGSRVQVHIVNGWWKDTGKPEDLLEANHLVLEDLKTSIRGSIADNVDIRGKIRVDKGSKIKGGCVLRGPVIIGASCDIGPNTYLGPYTSIGDNCIIKNVEIESSIIIGDSYIEGTDKITDSIVGRNSKIISEKGILPGGMKLVIGENSILNV